jgi:hypothetical protein
MKVHILIGRPANGTRNLFANGSRKIYFKKDRLTNTMKTFNHYFSNNYFKVNNSNTPQVRRNVDFTLLSNSNLWTSMSLFIEENPPYLLKDYIVETFFSCSKSQWNRFKAVLCRLEENFNIILNVTIHVYEVVVDGKEDLLFVFHCYLTCKGKTENQFDSEKYEFFEYETFDSLHSLKNYIEYNNITEYIELLRK